MPVNVHDMLSIHWLGDHISHKAMIVTEREANEIE